MIGLKYLYNFFPSWMQGKPQFEKQMLKEYLQLMMLDWLSRTPYARKLSFIGGTNLRLIRGIDRFSEDLDFDCKDLDEQEFREMTDLLVGMLKRQGLEVETKDKPNPRLTAFRRNLYFPKLLFELLLTGHREERFLIKVEAQDQGVEYVPEVKNVSGCGFFFPVQSPPDGILLAMKLSALVARQKGRDFYDVMFLVSQGLMPDYDFLRQRMGIDGRESLKEKLLEVVASVDLHVKKRDFAHLLFDESRADQILRFPAFIEQWF